MEISRRYVYRGNVTENTPEKKETGKQSVRHDFGDREPPPSREPARYTQYMRHEQGVGIAHDLRTTIAKLYISSFVGKLRLRCEIYSCA